MEIGPTDALVVIDVQNDFCPGGALPVPDGFRVAKPILRVMMRFEHQFFTRDWHPHDHCSFDELDPQFEPGSWPPHCVQNSPGAEFLGDLHVPSDAVIISKGEDPDVEPCSAFDGTSLHLELRARGIRRVFLCGLATDTTVRATALEAIARGHEVVLIADACRALQDETAAIQDLRAAGVMLCRSWDIAPD